MRAIDDWNSMQSADESKAELNASKVEAIIASQRTPLKVVTPKEEDDVSYT